MHSMWKRGRFQLLFVLEVHSSKKIKITCTEFLLLSVQIASSPRLLSNNIKIKMYQTTILPVVLCVCVSRFLAEGRCSRTHY